MISKLQQELARLQARVEKLERVAEYAHQADFTIRYSETESGPLFPELRAALAALNGGE